MSLSKRAGGRKPPEMTEKAFMGLVVQIAKLNKWLVYHTHDSRRSEAGYPDLCMVRGSRLIFAELKTENGVIAAAQHTWLDALKGTPAEVYVWRPSQMEEIKWVLSRAVDERQAKASAAEAIRAEARAYPR